MLNFNFSKKIDFRHKPDFFEENHVCFRQVISVLYMYKKEDKKYKILISFFNPTFFY